MAVRVVEGTLRQLGLLTPGSATAAVGCGYRCFWGQFTVRYDNETQEMEKLLFKKSALKIENHFTSLLHSYYNFKGALIFFKLFSSKPAPFNLNLGVKTLKINNSLNFYWILMKNG